MRPTTAARMLLGGAGLLCTRRFLPLWGLDPRSDLVVAVARILSARQLAQGAVVTLHSTGRADAVSVAVDLLHGGSMAALATVSRSYRRPATTSVCVALTLATVTGVRLAHSNRRRDPQALGVQQSCDVRRLRPVHTGSSPRTSAGPRTGSATPADLSPVTDEPTLSRGTAQRRPDAPRANRYSGDHRPTGSASHRELLRREAHERAAQITRRSESALNSATGAPMRSLSRAGALVLLALGVWLLIGQWLLSLPLTSVASTTGLRDEAFAVVCCLAALRLLTAGRSATATSVALLGGVLLVCSGFLLDHSVIRAAVNEVVCGAVTILGAMATRDRWRAGARGAGKHPVVAQIV